MSFYNIVALIFGDNEKSKRIFKIIKLLFLSDVFIVMIVSGIAEGVSVFHETSIWRAIFCWIIVVVLFVIWIICFKNVLKNDLKNLHALPDLKGIDFKGGKIKFKEPNGKSVFKVKYKNDYAIEVFYRDNEYHVLVKNDEWDILKVFTAKSNSELKKILADSVNLIIEQH